MSDFWIVTRSYSNDYDYGDYVSNDDEFLGVYNDIEKAKDEIRKIAKWYEKNYEECLEYYFSNYEEKEIDGKYVITFEARKPGDYGSCFYYDYVISKPEMNPSIFEKEVAE